jgi:hypothetical protein
VHAEIRTERPPPFGQNLHPAPPAKRPPQRPHLRRPLPRPTSLPQPPPRQRPPRPRHITHPPILTNAHHHTAPGGPSSTGGPDRQAGWGIVRGSERPLSSTPAPSAHLHKIGCPIHDGLIVMGGVAEARLTHPTPHRPHKTRATPRSPIAARPKSCQAPK